MDSERAVAEAVGDERVRGILKNLVRDPRDLRAVYAGVERAVAASFGTDIILRPVVTGDEMRRRGNLCLEGIARMMEGLDWPLARAIDHLEQYLRETLDGDDFIGRMVPGGGGLWPEPEREPLPERVRELVR